MGSYFDEVTFQHYYDKLFIFDLEYVGTTNNLSDCYIWDIGVIHVASGQKFSVTIDPNIRPLPKPFSNDFITLTEEFLREREAVSFAEAWKFLLLWVNGIINGGPAIWISHNCFKGDKIMLETDTRRNNITLPYTWFFFDSLLFFRKVVPKQSSYSLNDLYMNICGKPMEHHHLALPDATHLLTVLCKTSNLVLHGVVYPSYATSLQIIKWLGPSSEEKLIRNGICSLEELITTVMKIHSTSCVRGTLPNIALLIKDYLQFTHGIKPGNASSISTSIVQNWLPGL